MATNNTFSAARLGLLVRQNLYHNYKLLGLGVVGFSGAIFLMLLLFQTAEEFRQADIEVFVGMFTTIFFIGAVLSTGTAFPYFRTKEKSIAYLMLPASVTEKLVAEFLYRVVLFSVALPIIFWTVYLFEHAVVSMFATNYSVNTNELPDLSQLMHEIGGEYKVLILIGSMLFSVFMIPFMGSAIFDKAPLIKTLFSIAIIVFFNVLLIFFLVQVLGLKDYEPDESILFIDDPSEAITAGTWLSVILNIAMIAVTWFKLKEKEA